jgi:hypothetical protein
MPSISSLRGSIFVTMNSPPMTSARNLTFIARLDPLERRDSTPPSPRKLGSPAWLCPPEGCARHARTPGVRN